MIEFRSKVRAVNAAIRQGDIDVVKKYINGDEEILNAVGVSGSWMHAAASHGKLEIMEYLLGEGLPINIKGGPGNNKPICNAVSKGHTEVVRFLLSNGADVDTDHPMSNPLFFAILKGRTELARLLIETGMDTSIRYTTETMTNMSALDFAREYDVIEIAQMLEEAEGG